MTPWYKLPPNPKYPIILEMWTKGDHWIARTPFGIEAYWFERVEGSLILREQEVGSIEEGKALVDSKTAQEQE
jgi:hypothetical protein